MKTENTNTPETNSMNNQTLNTPTAETSTVTANTTETTQSEVTTSTAPDNSERLAELATKVRSTYADEQKADGMVVNWKAKKLKAGIEMGEYLIEAKSLLPFGEFVKWCKVNLTGLNQRTLNRYMKLAEKKTELSQVKGLAAAYQITSTAQPAGESTTAAEANTESAGESDGAQVTGQNDESQSAASDKNVKSDLQKDFKKVHGHLTKAKDILNGYQGVASSKEADAICDLISALAGWVSEYRGEETSLPRLNAVDFGMPIVTDKQPTTPEHNAEYVTAE